jgi:integral membrane sensor domain MASE1
MLLALCALYFAAGKLGLMLAFAHANATAVWPPTGIALAAFLLLGGRVWPAIFAGAFLVNITTSGTVATSLGIATGNMLEGLLAAHLVKRFARGRNAFYRAQDWLKFVGLAGVLSPTVSATLGLTSLSAAGFARWSDYASIWFTWWLGDAGGALLVAPALILWNQNSFRWDQARVWEAAILALVLVLVGEIVFGGWFPGEIKNYELTYLCLPILVWTAVRFGPRETAIAVLLLSVIAVGGTLSGYGPFFGGSPNQSLVQLQAFMAATAVSGMFFAAVLHQNRRVQAKRERVLRKLQSAFDQIQTLRGLVPICAACKKIRNHDGVWEQLEVYIENRSEARFTHGICPDCSTRFR